MNKWFSLGAFVLVLSLGMNIYLGEKALHYYTILNALRLDPLELKRIAPQSPPKTSTYRMMMYGDSRAQGWPAIELRDVEVLNHGISMQTSIQITERYHAHVVPFQPDIIVLQLGMNDVKTIGLFPERRDEIVANYKENLDELIQKSIAQHTNVVVTTILPIGSISLMRTMIWSQEIDKARIELNDHIRSLDKEGVYVFDAAQHVMDEEGYLDHRYAFDELHLNSLGYAQINRYFQPFMRDVVQGDSRAK